MKQTFKRTRPSRPGGYNSGTVCDQIVDAAAQIDVSVEARFEGESGNLILTAPTYTDYLLAKKIALDQFGFSASNVLWSTDGRTDLG
jgi:hypothetical protein